VTRPTEPALIPARPVRGRHGAVASPHHLASQAGLQTLRSGGSAVDAAIATNAALAVVNGDACGLGGDAFWLIWDEADGDTHALNGSGRSGGRATIEAVRADGQTTMPERGRWSISVPGAVHSWGAAHERFGRLAWGDLLAPAIDLADGFAATPAWLGAVERAAGVFGVDGDWARTYRPDDRATLAGRTVRLPALARTLRALASEGPDFAYTGALAARTAEYFAARGVPIDATDLADHSSDWGKPIRLDYRGVASLSHPPNSVGVVALQTLGLLKRMPAPVGDAFDGQGWRDAAWIHAGLEASRLALMERDAWVTDPRSMPASTVETMLSDARLDALAARIDPAAAMPPAQGSLPGGGGTVYLTAADRWGNVVSLIESNYLGFGSGLVDPVTGIAFHDRAAFFRLDPRHPNALAPRKRPTHTLAPGLLLRAGRPWIAHGSMGGEIQPQVFAQFVSAMVDAHSDVATAVAAPRWAAMMREQHGPPDMTQLESRVRPEVVAALTKLGHVVTLLPRWDSTMGHAHAIEIVRDADGGVESFAAASDPRSEGAAVAC
jgi:gamma-glutamyltranspeptidase/glutathione hydrolase